MNDSAMNESRRLSSLSEEPNDVTGADTHSGAPRFTQSLPPPTSTSTGTNPHSHHRITSFDINDYSSLSTREIHQRNENAMSILSSLTTPSTHRRTTERRKAVTVKLASPTDVESKKQELAVRPEHLVKIFTTDHDVMEVTPSQVKRIKKMHESIEDSVNFSFNYNVLLLVASILAGLGLVTNNGTTIIASMLVSPIMGPVIGLGYGTTIWDWALVRKSLRNECISLLFAIAMGMTIGACTGWTSLAESWPTPEMESRGNLQNFLVALPVAFFSGLGVAVSILDQQTASLVGVAISASLLPPAVDAGVLWIAYAFTKHGIIPVQPIPLPAPLDGTPEAAMSDATLTPEELHEYTREEYRQMGVLSLSVTLANIILIWISSMLMFRLKETLPIKKKVFWSDLKVTRRIYQRRALLQVVEVDPTGEGKDDVNPGLTESQSPEDEYDEDDEEGNEGGVYDNDSGDENEKDDYSD